MPNPPAVVTTVAPLGSAGVFTSGPEYVQRAVAISGTVFADQAGTLKVQQGGDGINWDTFTSFTILASAGQGFNVLLVSPYWQITYTNGGTPQTIFRLFANPSDPYGEFLQPAATPSPGGAYAVLQSTPNGGYSYVGRFNGNSGWDACSAAAVSQNQSAKYAAFAVAQATVADETVQLSAQPTPDAF